jgi:hypothetical protein
LLLLLLTLRLLLFSSGSSNCGGTSSSRMNVINPSKFAFFELFTRFSFDLFSERDFERRKHSDYIESLIANVDDGVTEVLHGRIRSRFHRFSRWAVTSVGISTSVNDDVKFEEWRFADLVGFVTSFESAVKFVDGALEHVLESVGEAAVDFSDEFVPVGADHVAVLVIVAEVVEELLHNVGDFSVSKNQLLTNKFLVLLLAIDKFLEKVFTFLFDTDGEGFVGNVVADVVNGANSVLEVINTILNLFGLDAAFANKVFDDTLRRPSGFVETSSEFALQEGDAEREEFAPRRERLDDVVVGTNSNGDILTINAETFFAKEDFDDRLRNSFAHAEPVARFFNQDGEFNREVDGVAFQSVGEFATGDQELIQVGRRNWRNLFLPAVVLSLDVLIERTLFELTIQNHRLGLFGLEIPEARQEFVVLFDAEAEVASPSSATSVRRIQPKNRWFFDEFLLNKVEFSVEEREDGILLFVDVAVEFIALGEVVERFEEFSATFHSGDKLERTADDLNHHESEIVELVFELMEVITPVASLDVENIVVEIAETFHFELEGALNIKELRFDFRTFGTTEARENTGIKFNERSRNTIARDSRRVEDARSGRAKIFTSSSSSGNGLARKASRLALVTELELSDANFLEIHATMLDEAVDFGEDVDDFELFTTFAAVTLTSSDEHLGAGRNPGLASFDGFFESDHRIFNITVKDGLEIDLLAAAIDDFVGDHAEKAEKAITLVVTRVHQEHVDSSK